MRAPWRELSVCLLFGLGGCGSSCENLQLYDTCETPEAPRQGAVSELQIGGPEGDAGQNTPFVQLLNGAGVSVVRGSQGADMIVVRLRLRGSAPPRCVAVSVKVTGDKGLSISEVQEPLRTYPEGVGTLPSVFTRDVYLPGGYSQVLGFGVQVTAQAADASATAQLHVRSQSCGSVDRCVDGCGADDACAARCLGDADPQALSLFTALDGCRRSYCQGAAGDMGGGSPDAGTSPLRCTSSGCYQCLENVQRSPGNCTGAADCGRCASAAADCLRD